ncbi:hypothetical protein [Hymenobacter cheonanensis]|uniref:hypothetical protein n=1 Tax=Hymenobacter sp. CA2-7 TaxID=3063993 RepID=UPI0027130FE2|nr:hypothetical protein [Hymenobacter sp. CA2-7]MDO7885323.1 hypothetical protein [Hymenobacter sp. CA2-7]
MQFYTSQPTNGHLANLALSLTRPGRQVRLLPLADLPPAQPLRLGPLRIEQSELLTSLAFTNWGLALLANGTWQPDVVLETNLRLDKAALEKRLLEVTQLLTAQEGGQVDG